MDDRQAILNKAIAKAIGARVIADGSVKLRIRCVGYPASTKHYADAVVVSSTALTLSIDGAIDTTVGSAGVLAFETYTTLGALVDAINLSANWEAEIVAGLRSDAINGSELLARSTSAFKMWEEVSLYADSSDPGVYKISFLLEPGTAFEYARKSLLPNYKRHRVGLQRVRAKIDTSDAGTWDLNIYELKPDKASVYKTLFSATTADVTEKDSGAQQDVMFHADYGNSILVEAVDASWQDAGAYLEVQGVRE